MYLRFQLRRSVALVTFFALAAAVPVAAHDAPAEPQTLIRRLAFGSCNSPLDATPVWEAVVNRFPDAWIWLGDTVYADSPRPQGPTPEARARVSLDRLAEHYARQRDLPGYRLLRQRARILGTWDDHDFGQNDAGADFVGRTEAQRHFLDFYGEPADSPRRNRPGIYASWRFGPPGRVVQIVALDTRYFRSPLRRGDSPESAWIDGVRGTYLPSADPDATILGADQWRWLESVLRQPADVRVIASSIQIISDDHRFEKWGNFPAERRRLLALIRATGATGVVLQTPPGSDPAENPVSFQSEAKGRTNPRLSTVGSAKADGDASLQTPIQLQREEIGAAKRPGPKGTTASPS